MDITRHPASQKPRRLTRPGIADMLQYWESLRGNAPVPARSQIDPMALQPYLSNAGIAELTEAGTVKLRLGGVTFTNLLGVDPRGMPLRAMFEPAARDHLSGLLAATFEGPQVLTMTLLADRKHAPSVTGQMVVMPLRDMRGEVTRALIGVVVDPHEADTPLRFRIRNANLNPAGNLLSAEALNAAPRPTRVSVERGDRSFLRVIEGGLA